MSTLKIATWNVNGIRARAGQVVDFVATEQPDVLCLQEIKATPDQIPGLLLGLEGYATCWHGQGTKGYSGVALHVRHDLAASAPPVRYPPFDFECRAVTREVAGITVASIYVPNGGKDYEAKKRFLDEMIDFAARYESAGTPLVICGDLNVAHTDRDVHPKERKRVVGQLPEERERFDRLLGRGLVDVGRQLHPDDEEYFTWWAPWRNMRQRNIGWRLDYVLASRDLAVRARACDSQREVGTSDHGPVVATFDWP
jgi:exodeoxyribonuclease-3